MEDCVLPDLLAGLIKADVICDGEICVGFVIYQIPACSFISYGTVYKRKQSIVLAHSYIGSGFDFGTALSYQNVR